MVIFNYAIIRCRHRTKIFKIVVISFYINAIKMILLLFVKILLR